MTEHGIRAIIGTHKDILPLADDWRIFVNEIQLPQGYGMVFLTDAILDDIAELAEPSDALYEPELITFAGQSHFTAEAAILLRQYSFRTRFAYIETNYCGGVCTQAGILYANGSVSIAPREGEGSINLLLKALGVWRMPGKDEFDSLRLGIYRRMDKWLTRLL